MSNHPETPAAGAAGLTRHPQRLQALFELWRGAQQDVWVTLQGGSMIPAIRPGSRLRLSCGDHAPVPGEIIAFRREALLVIHRLLRVDAQGRLICQGDANRLPDPPVTLQEVVGVVVEVHPPSLRVRVQGGVRHVGRILKRVCARFPLQDEARHEVR